MFNALDDADLNYAMRQIERDARNAPDDVDVRKRIAADYRAALDELAARAIAKNAAGRAAIFG